MGAWAGVEVWRVVLAPALWLERARGRRRLALIALYLGLGLIVGLLVFRQSRLIGLPDVGDPFDPAPLLAWSVPDDQNAFVLYREALARSQHNPVIERRLLNGPWAWPPATDVEGLDFLDRNAEALELWRRGSECPEALERPIAALRFDSALTVVQEHRHFVRLASLQVSKAQADGDMARAWVWLRAILRGSRQVGRHGLTISQIVGTAEYSMGAGLAKTWMADQRTSPALLREALEDVRTLNALTPPASEAMRIEYLAVMKTLDEPEALWQFLLDDPWSMRTIDGTAWYNHQPTLQAARRSLEHEPERTRRLMRLTFANWLAHCDDPPDERPALIGPQSVPTNPGPSSLASVQCVYDAPAPRGPLPRDLVERLRRSWLAQTLTIPYSSFLQSVDRDRGQRAGLVVSLAEELFRRDQGREPDSPRELIGPYLEHFPEGYAPP